MRLTIPLRILREQLKEIYKNRGMRRPNLVGLMSNVVETPQYIMPRSVFRKSLVAIEKDYINGKFKKNKRK